MKAFFYKYRHAFVLFYGFIYMPWFLWLESRANLPYHVIHVGLDDLIPFSEGFIVPYLLWFVYIAAVFVYLFFQLDKKREFYQYCIFLFTGMTLFLVVSTIYPNGHLHVYNSIAAHVAVVKNQKLRGNIWIRGGSFLLMMSIILATMFLKQHSMLDVIAGTLLGILMEQLVYHTDFSFVRARKRKPVGA